MSEKMDKNVLLSLLAQADTRWFNSHPGIPNYREHLEFTAEYIAKNYNKESKKIST